MPPLKFQSPEGKIITVDSPDGSIPTEQELDQLFAMAGNKQPASQFTPSAPQSFGNKLLTAIAQVVPLTAGVKSASEIYPERIAPIVEGLSTLALGIPKATAGMVPGAKEAMYPEQKTPIGKVLRFGSETAGLLGGGALKAGGWAAGKALSKLVAPRLLKKMAAGAIAGGVAGVLQTPEEGKGILKPKERLQQGATSSVLGAVLPTVVPATKAIFRGMSKVGRIITGVEKEVLREVEQKGFRKVISTKFLNKKMPEVIQGRIEQNIDNLETAAGQKYDELTAPLRKTSFDMAELRGKVIKAANRIKKSPFDTEVSKLDNEILDGIVNKAQVKNLGDALDLRRNLDDIIYTGRGELKSTFGKEVRNILNRALHKNTALKDVDAQWTSLQNALRAGRKVIGETGENFLKRFANLTAKQKQMLVELERQIGGEPFVEDLTKWGLAQKFATPIRPLSSFSSAIQAVTKPGYRGFLRKGEAVTRGMEKLEETTIGRLLKKIVKP